MAPFLKQEPARLAVKLTAAGERSVKRGHPWVFSDSIEQLKPAGRSGDLAIVFGRRDNRFVGVGLYDPNSPIRIKMLHHGRPTAIDQAFFAHRMERAYRLRQGLLDGHTDAYRLIYGENDGFPGLIADLYAHVLVIKLYSAIWLPYLETLTKVLVHRSEASAALLRLSRSLQKSREVGLSEGSLLYGELKDPEVLFKEAGVRFKANVVRGHKTGFFLDHRHNRIRVGELAKNKTMLDVFCYAGGFSVHALANGAREVTSLDVSQHALDLAKTNATLNPHKGTHLLLQGDAFQELETLVKAGKKYDLIVIDPPSFAKEKSQIQAAKKKYAQLCRLGASLCKAKGILMMASCSSRVGTTEFYELVKDNIRRFGRSFEVMETSGHDLDHPISFPEGAYLKAIYLRFTDPK